MKKNVSVEVFAAKLGAIDVKTVAEWKTQANAIGKMLMIVDENGNEIDATLVIGAAVPTEAELTEASKAEDEVVEDDELPKGKSATADDEKAESNAVVAALATMKRQLEATIRTQAVTHKLLAHKISGGGDFRNDDEKRFGFKSMAEQLQAIAKYGATGGRVVDQRLYTKAPTGLNETTDSQGGFLLAPEFSDRILQIMHEESNLLDLVDAQDIKGPSIKVPAIDETSRATGSRRGGIRGYWVAEGATITSSKPKFRQIDMSPHKLAVLVYTTEELLADGGSMLENMISQGAADEINFLVGDSIINGTGAGQPLGILNSPCVVEVSKESGQAGSTVVTENIVKMHARLHRSSNPKAVWLINQDIEPQLHTLNQAVGTGGQLVYLPPGGLSDKPFGTLYGKRIVTTEWNATLGTAGDIILADLKQYLAVTRGAVKGASSMHVAFTTDEQAFRFTFRIDGQPWWNSALTPFKGTGNTQSPFITLAARA